MTAIVNETVSVKKKPSGRRVIFASAFGNALEFFDFGVYNFFVVYISTLFFPPSADHNVANRNAGAGAFDSGRCGRW